MSEKKILRVIDSRNLLYGTYKYQVRPGRMVGVSHYDVQSWCREKWGPNREWAKEGVYNYQQYNFHWRVVQNGRKAPLIYLQGDAEATMFSLAWAGK